MRTIKEAQASRQAKEIFNNGYEQIVEHFEEECNELLVELKAKHTINTMDEMADVAYMFNQICERFETDYNSLLAYAINKNENKRK